MIVTLLATGMGLAGCTNTSKRVATSPTTSSAENRSIPVIPVVLPTLADVELTKGEPKSGRVTKITDKELSIELSGQAEAIAIKDIKRVKFKQEAPLPRGSNPRLRSDSEVWRVMPMTDFQIKDSRKGLAEVQQSAVLKEKQPPSDFLGEPSSYEVNEIWFDSNSPGTMRLKVKGIN